MVIIVTVIVAAATITIGATSRRTLKRLRTLRLRSSNPIPAGAMAVVDKIVAVFTPMAAAGADKAAVTSRVADIAGKLAAVISGRPTTSFDLTH